ncbi:MAG: hypothetical protein H0X25_16930 [Acidobacteriales bacterium]|nr:hypothetical protein [Terriglobales bacterium]
MAGTYSITAAEQTRIFQCPSCKETINTSAAQCPYCSAPIDAGAAEAAANLMHKVNDACSDASYLRIMAGSLLVAFIVSLIPMVSWVGTLAYCFLVFAVPVMAARWWAKFASLKSDDRDFPRAKRTVLIALTIWAPFALLFALSVLGRVSHR